MTPEEIFEKQLRSGRSYRDLFKATSALFLHHDPIRDDFAHGPEEYRLEAQEVLARLRSCRSELDVTRLVHKTFVVWRGEKAGSQNHYEQIGRELWSLLEEQSAT